MNSPGPADPGIAAIEALFVQACDLPLAERDPFLDSACPNLQVRRKVERLLAADATAGEFLERGALGDLYDDRKDELAPGQTIGGYELIRHLGMGGSSSVWLAIQRSEYFERRVAVKFLERVDDEHLTEERFATEVRILAGLDHPNIVRFYDAGRTASGKLYVAMELVEGETLLEHCRRHRLPATERLTLFTQICDAVQYAHDSSIIHRDLKPGNILVTGDGRVKLLDFGIARWLRPELAPGKLVATLPWQRRLTPAYASPEQARGEPTGPATDIYSLGVLLAELINGRRPDQGEGATLFASSDLPETTATSLSHIVQRALAPLPEQRFASPEALTMQVQLALTDPPRHRLDGRVAGIAATLVLLVALILTRLGGSRPEVPPSSERPDSEVLAEVPPSSKKPDFGATAGATVEVQPSSVELNAETPAEVPPSSADAIATCRKQIAAKTNPAAETLRKMVRCLISSAPTETVEAYLEERYAALRPDTDYATRVATLQAFVKHFERTGQTKRGLPYAEELRATKASRKASRRTGSQETHN